LRVFSFAELKSATKNFRPETVLGEGGFGRVYKGWIDEKIVSPAASRSGSKIAVAIKKLNSESVQGFEEWQVQYIHVILLKPRKVINSLPFVTVFVVLLNSLFVLVIIFLTI